MIDEDAKHIFPFCNSNFLKKNTVHSFTSVTTQDNMCRNTKSDIQPESGDGCLMSLLDQMNRDDQDFKVRL